MSVGNAVRLASAALALLLVGCGGEPEAPARHVVLVSLDALGARHVGAYGHEADTTPNLDAIAEQGWVRTLPCQWAERGGLDGFFIARLQRI